MKCWCWFIPCVILCAGCQLKEEESADLDRMALFEDEEQLDEPLQGRKEIAGELPASPQEKPL